MNLQVTTMRFSARLVVVVRKSPAAALLMGSRMP